MITLREYWLILILLLAIIATIGISYGRVLITTVEQTVKFLQVKR